jgi:peptidoglycan hydrolase-like protein with peptidoglycan-binding domain
VKQRRVIVAGTAVVVIAGAGATAAAVMEGGDDTSTAAGRRLPKATGTVTRGDLVDSQTVDGTLGYGAEETVTGGASGKVTWLPAEGATVTRGKTLYDLNGKPVTLMYGGEPIYRTLREGVDDGDDVRQLERNLKALGYGDDLDVDDDFTYTTELAVQEWQDDRGLPETGEIDGSQIVFAPGAVRVSARPVPNGGRVSNGAPLLKVTGTERLVKVALDTGDQHLARKGAKVRVELPGNEIADAKISKVGTVATPKKSGGDSSGGSSTEATIEVDIVLDDPRKAGNLDQAPVSVRLESERHRDVLSVPVEALVAQRDGGYAVQVVEGATARLVPVKTGLFADSRVEVSGQGLTAGMKVGVPSR